MVDGAAEAESAVAVRLSVARLTLTDFRCYRAQRLETDGRSVVLTGANGAGKTNVLEALSFLVPGRGLRGARLAEVARRQDGSEARAWGVAARLRTPGGLVEVGTGRVPDPAGDGRDKRVVHIDGQPEKSQAALTRHVSAHWLTPQMDRLFMEGAAARRRFLDRLVFGFDPAHAGRVAAYEHAMRERARLLRHGPGRAGDGDPRWLAALEDTLATTGVAVAAARLETAARLHQVCARPVGPFPGAALRVDGVVEGWLEDGPALDAEDRLRRDLAAARRADAVAGGASLGPHKSDLVVEHLSSGQPAAQCSTGEQKALLIAIVLANARLQGDERGGVPLLLLDEVVAHLDQARREALFAEIASLGAQAWLTGTDRSFFEPLGGAAQFFTVADAVVAPAGRPGMNGQTQQ
jgi:DNA replication and repair protein RecF